MDNPNIVDIEELRKQLKEDIIRSLYETGGGHYGGALSVLDILISIYCSIDIELIKDNSEYRDRIILSKGHACIAQYAILKSLGVIQDDLNSYGSFGSALQGHPDMTLLNGIDFSTGSLGQGLSISLGMALSMKDTPSRVYCILGDGECQEGQVWEALLLGPRLGLDNIILFIDNNKFQELGWADSIISDPVPDIAKKLDSFGWETWEIDGHNLDELFRTMEVAKERKNNTPKAIVCNTIKGFGVALFESDPTRFHCCQITSEEFNKIMS